MTTLQFKSLPLHFFNYGHPPKKGEILEKDDPHTERTSSPPVLKMFFPTHGHINSTCLVLPKVGFLNTQPLPRTQELYDTPVTRYERIKKILLQDMQTRITATGLAYERR